MHQTKKGNQWYFGMKAHLGVDAGTGYAHTVTATAANVHDLDEASNLVRDDDQTVYADYGYQGAAKRPEIAGHEHLSKLEWRIAARKGALKTMHEHDRAIESRTAAVRAKVEHPFLIVKRDFAFTKTRDPRDRQEPQPPPRAVRLGELANAGPCRRPHTGGGVAPACPKPAERDSNRDCGGQQDHALHGRQGRPTPVHPAIDPLISDSLTQPARHPRSIRRLDAKSHAPLSSSWYSRQIPRRATHARIRQRADYPVVSI
jgi:IS5 family transposase